MVGAWLLAAAISLNGSWEFRFEKGKPCAEADPAFEATDVIQVPGCFDAMPKWFMKRGTGLYRRRFTLERPTQNAWLTIDGMGLYGRFWVDGREIGTNDLPWSRVKLPMGALSAGEHTVVAAIDNRFDWNYQKLVRTYYDFHCWGGFFHGVSVELDNRTLHVRTRDYRTGEIELEAVGFASDAFEAELLFDGQHTMSAEFRDARTVVRVPNFKLWSPDHPNLHTVAIRSTHDQTAPTCAVRFGIRTIEARNRGIYLNGERIFLKGVNRHEQQLQLGASTPEGFMLADIQNLKAMGGNFIRGAHYPQSQRFLELCDECGVMVWEESLGWGNGQRYTMQNGINELEDAKFIELQLRQTKLMVRNSFNHPSVIIFAFLNEQNSALPSAKALTDRLIATIREEDSGRLITFACNITEKDICHENTDIIAFNTYPGTINGYPGEAAELREKIFNMKGYGINWVTAHFRQKYPDKTIMISEIGVAGDYGSFDPSVPIRSEDFQVEHNRLVAEAVYGNADIAGLCYWQFFDTRTSGRDCLGSGKKPNAMSRAGLFNWYRQPKRTVGMISEWFRNAVPENLKTPSK